MSYESTSSIPTNRIRKQKQIDFSDADGTAKDIWIPANGTRIYMNDVILTVLNKDASNHVIVAVQLFVGSSWETLVPIAVTAQSSSNFAYNFGGRVRTGEGDGSTARIRVVHTGPSTNWESYGGVTGEEK